MKKYQEFPLKNFTMNDSPEHIYLDVEYVDTAYSKIDNYLIQTRKILMDSKYLSHITINQYFDLLGANCYHYKELKNIVTEFQNKKGFYDNKLVPDYPKIISEDVSLDSDGSLETKIKL